MKFRQFWALAAALHCALALLTGVNAAEIQTTIRPGQDPWEVDDQCPVSLTGTIEVGDAAKLLALLGDNRTQKGMPITFCLDSTGGNFEEGLKIAEISWERNLSTLVLPDKQCLSACAIVFMTGTELSTGGVGLARTMHSTSKIGFHAPSIVVAGGEFDADDLDAAYSAAVDGVGKRLLGIAKLRGRTWANPLIKGELVNEMMKRRGSDFYYIDTVRKAIEFEISVADATGPSKLSKASMKSGCENVAAYYAGSAMGDWLFTNELENPVVCSPKPIPS